MTNLTYEEGIRELDPPFVLTRLNSIRINILNLHDPSNPKVCARVTTTVVNLFTVLLPRYP